MILLQSVVVRGEGFCRTSNLDMKLVRKDAVDEFGVVG